MPSLRQDRRLRNNSTTPDTTTAAATTIKTTTTTASRTKSTIKESLKKKASYLKTIRSEDFCHPISCQQGLLEARDTLQPEYP